MIDFNHLPDEALLRSGDFLSPGPVPMGRTRWNAAVAAGDAPQPVSRGHRATLYRWGDIRAYLIKLAGDAPRGAA